MTHFNVQITVQKVTEAVPPQAGRIVSSSGEPRKVLDLVSVHVSATTEAEAYAKARRMLDASETAAAPALLPAL